MAVASLAAHFDSQCNAATTKCAALIIKMQAHFSDLQNFNIHRTVCSYHLEESLYMTKATSINIFLLHNQCLHAEASL